LFYLTNLDPGVIESKLDHLENDVQLISFTREKDCSHGRHIMRYFENLSKVTSKIQFQTYTNKDDRDLFKRYKIKRMPAIAIRGQKDFGIRYYGTPADWELFNFLDDIIDVSHTDSGFTKQIRKQLKKIRWPINLQLFTSSTYPYSRLALKTAIYAAIENDFINVDIIDATEFFDLVKKYHVHIIPFTVVNEDYSYYGVLNAEDFIERLVKLKPRENLFCKWKKMEKTLDHIKNRYVI